MSSHLLVAGKEEIDAFGLCKQAENTWRRAGSRSRPGGGFPFLFSLPLDGTKEAHRAQKAYCLLCFSGLCGIFISELQRMECVMPFVWRQPEAARRKE